MLEKHYLVSGIIKILKNYYVLVDRGLFESLIQCGFLGSRSTTGLLVSMDKWYSSLISSTSPADTQTTFTYKLSSIC